MPAFQTSLVADHLKKVARDTVFNHISTKDSKRDAERVRAALVHTLSNVLHNMKQCSELQDFHVQVDVGDAIRLGERDIPKDAKPGDAYGATGIVVSSDGDGHGVVFDPHAPDLDPGQVHVKVDIRQFMPVEYLSIQFTVADTAY